MEINRSLAMKPILIWKIFEKYRNSGNISNFKIIIILISIYRIRRCPVPPPLSSPPVSMEKSWSLTISLKKIILKILELEITSKKKFLNFSFHYVRYCNHIITFLEIKFLISLLFFQALNEVSQSNIFLVFFC